MGVAMSQYMYRDEPLMDFQTEMGANYFYNFGASRVTGWRKSQEDRLICLPDFHNDFSLFAVFDGHGGSEVAEYLVNIFPSHLATLLENNDNELALQLCFLTCDSCLRNLSDDKLPPSDEASDESLMEELPVLPSRKAVSPILRAFLNNVGAAGTSTGGSESMPENLKSTIASETLKFLTSGELEPEESDDSDENYDENMESSASEGSDSNQSEDHDSEPEHEDVKEAAGEASTAKRLQFCGSTGTVVLLNRAKAYIANVGDSRCIASVKGEAVELSVDHKPTDEEELERIRKAGSRVTSDGRIDGGLNMSRAFGDFAHKKDDDIEQPIICDPHITSIDVNEDLDFIVVASDGIWNSLSNQEVVDYVSIRIKDTRLSDICEELFKFILAPDSAGDGTGCDNMSMAIIEVNKKNESIKNFHICYDDMELDEDNSEMESHNFADESGGKKMLDGNTENKKEEYDKSTENSNGKYENKDFSRSSNNAVGKKKSDLCEKFAKEEKQSIQDVVDKNLKTLHAFCCNVMQDPLPLAIQINVALKSASSRVNRGIYGKSVRAPYYNVQSILYDNNPCICYKKL